MSPDSSIFGDRIQQGHGEVWRQSPTGMTTITGVTATVRRSILDFQRTAPQMISMNAIDDAWKKVVDKKARYRFVIDVAQR
jgi:hypothetical protein